MENFKAKMSIFEIWLLASKIFSVQLTCQLRQSKSGSVKLGKLSITENSYRGIIYILSCECQLLITGTFPNYWNLSFINLFPVNTLQWENKTRLYMQQLHSLCFISTDLFVKNIYHYSLPSLFILIHQNRDHKVGGKVLFSLWQQRVIACPLLSNLQKYFGNRSRLYHGICMPQIHGTASSIQN